MNCNRDGSIDNISINYHLKEKMKTVYKIPVIISIIVIVLAIIASLGGMVANNIYRNNELVKSIWLRNGIVTLFIVIPIMIGALFFSLHNSFILSTKRLHPFKHAKSPTGFMFFSLCHCDISKKVLQSIHLSLRTFEESVATHPFVIARSEATRQSLFPLLSFP